MKLKLNNKNVLVTASSTGIGFATAKLFLEEESNVTICSSNSDKIRKAADELNKINNEKLLFLKCDINNPKEIEETINTSELKFGKIDILVNNCGGPVPGFFDTLDEKDWNNGYNQVLMSVVRFIKIVLPNMKKQKWGRIINITSISVKQPIDNLLLSNSFRSAVTAFAKTLSNQVGKFNITVNNVAPGLTLTGRLNELALLRAKEAGITKDEMLIKMSSDIPLKRMASPEEIASMIVYLSSDLGGYITGQTIVVDGGYNKSTY